MNDTQLSLKSRCAVCLLWIVLIGLAGFVGYQQIFSTFAEYDDEGYVMISLRSFLDGHPLYDETFSQYGPAFYFVEGAIHRLANLPITHNIVRLKTIVSWLAVALVSAFYVNRLASQDGRIRKTLTSVLTFCLVFLHLDRLCLEPGHPQELCAIGIVGCLLLSTFVADAGNARRKIVCGMLGAICSIVLLTKLNVGVFLTAAVGSTLVLLQPDSRSKKYLVGCVYAGLAMLPLLLYRHHLLEVEAGLLALLTSLAGVAVVFVFKSRNYSGSTIGFPELTSYSVVGILAVVTVLVATLLAGTSVQGLAYGLVGQHSGFQQYFFHPPPVTLLLVGVGLLLTVYASRSDRNLFNVAALVLLGCIGAYLNETWRPLIHGLNLRGRADLLMSVGPGFLVLLMINSRSNNEFAPRLCLALISLLQPLASYPTPGTQTAVGSFCFIIVCILLLNDGLRALPVAELVGSFQSKTLAGFAAAAICLLIARSVVITNYRADLEPLAMPGADRLRLEQDFVEKQQWIVSQLQGRADTFVFGEQGGTNCLYFWSKINPPTALNATFWPLIMRDADQLRVIEALETYPNACVARSESDPRLPRGPLTKYIDAKFHKAIARGKTEIWVRNERDVERMPQT